MSEEYSVGYSEGYQAGWNAAIETTPPAAPAAPVQEPVGRLRMGPKQDFVTTGAAGDLEINVWHPVYTTPPAAPVREPMALETVYETIIHWDEGGGKRSRRELARRIVDLYTTPPAAQPAVPLTDEQRRAIIAKLSEADYADGDEWDNALFDAIEAAHGIKENT